MNDTPLKAPLEHLHVSDRVSWPTIVIFSLLTVGACLVGGYNIYVRELEPYNYAMRGCTYRKGADNSAY